MNSQAAGEIAGVLLSGNWRRQDALARLQDALGTFGKNRKWPEKLIDAVFLRARFRRKPRAARLKKFLCYDPLVNRVTSRASAGITKWMQSRPIDARRPNMQPASAVAEKWAVPEITTSGKLAGCLGLRLPQLAWLADRRNCEYAQESEKLRHYRYSWVEKKSGGRRLVESPKQELKRAQRWALDNILRKIPVHDAAHAFCRGRSTLTAIAPHVGQYVVLRIDLRDYFPGIHGDRVAGIFRHAGYPPRIVSLLTGLCTNTTWRGVLDEIDSDPLAQSTLFARHKNLFQPHLPQGAPTSPALANLCTWSLDRRLTGLARKFSAQFTRYADDLIFSGGREFARQQTRLRSLALAIAIDEGFEIRHRKTRLMYENDRQRILGIVVNKSPGLARDEFDRLKATLYNCVRHGPGSQNQLDHVDFKSHLEGQVAYARQLNARRGQQLEELLNLIDWSR